ncbi:MAG TPA: NADH-quinone oxidoreductase subunit N [Nitriliruptorales bacterium]|nr:NADH-quinone oxidoreductase subunit N [Nitriliruptorales bacterium]
MTIDFAAIGPELALTATALLVLLADLVLDGDRKRVLNPLAAAGTAVAIWATLAIWGEGRSTFDGVFVASDFALTFKLLFLVTLLAVLAVSYHYFAEGRFFQGEYYFLLLTAFVGMLVMPSARDLLLLFVALETISLPGFVMAGLRKRDLYSSEAALKFFLIGVLAVAVMLFGLSFVYGAAGTTTLDGIATALAGGGAEPLLLGSLLMVIVGFGFKVSAVPFHFWAPDTYAGSPLPVTAMLAVASKAAGFAGLVSICFIAFEPLADVWAPAMGVLAVVTMTVGNLVALQQRDIVRLLAYSSVGQAGYILLPFGLAAPGAPEVNELAVQAVLFYLVAYAVMNVGAFAVVIAVHRRSGRRSIADYAGLGQRAPGLAVAMTLFMLSLGGAVPLVGFWAKFVVFQAAAGSGGYVLATFLVVNTVLAFFYYLAVVRTMWMEAPPVGAPLLQPGRLLNAAVGVLAVATVVLGVVPLYQNLPVGQDVVGGRQVVASGG